MSSRTGDRKRKHLRLRDWQQQYFTRFCVNVTVVNLHISRHFIVTVLRQCHCRQSSYFKTFYSYYVTWSSEKSCRLVEPKRRWLSSAGLAQDTLRDQDRYRDQERVQHNSAPVGAIHDYVPVGTLQCWTPWRLQWRAPGLWIICLRESSCLR